MRPQLKDGAGTAAELFCPKCGGNYLNHDKVEIFDRSEDKPLGLHVSVIAGRATVDSEMAGNPSSRRHGLTITFACESCGQQSVLSIGQHKGNTEVDFV
jgi:hypothetical protein